MELPANLSIIGLHSERPRSGKTTVASALATITRGRVHGIADGIRHEARKLGFASAADARGDAKDVSSPSLGGFTPRQVLCMVGGSRAAAHGATFWLDRLLDRIAQDAASTGDQPVVAVIDDVRRREEGQALIEAGATVCTIVHDGAPDVVDINGWRSGLAYTFRNDATPEECARRILARTLRDRKDAA